MSKNSQINDFTGKPITTLRPAVLPESTSLVNYVDLQNQSNLKQVRDDYYAATLQFLTLKLDATNMIDGTSHKNQFKNGQLEWAMHITQSYYNSYLNNKSLSVKNMAHAIEAYEHLQLHFNQNFAIKEPSLPDYMELPSVIGCAFYGGIVKAPILTDIDHAPDRLDIRMQKSFNEIILHNQSSTYSAWKDLCKTINKITVFESKENDPLNTYLINKALTITRANINNIRTLDRPDCYPASDILKANTQALNNLHYDLA